MDPVLEQKFNDLGKTVEDFKAAHSKELAEIKAKGHASEETKAQVEKLNTAISNIQGDIDGIKTALNRTNKGGGEDKGEKSEYGKALNSFLRKGVEPSQALHLAEAKSMNVQVDEDGGFLVTPEVSSEIVTKVYESSPMRQLASAQSISTDSLEILQDLDECGSGWVGETEARTNTSTPQFKKLVIPVHELYAQPAATQKLLDDAAINIESWLAGKVSEKFGRDEATAFVSGSGVGKAKGFLAYAAGTSFDQIERFTTATQGVFVADELIDLCYLLKGAYKTNASWLMQRNTVKNLRKFKDVTSGQYLWQPGLNGAAQSSFLGHPIYEANDMATLVGVGATDASKEPIAFGDFKAGYQIVDRIGIRVLRDPYTTKPYVLFYTTKRVGGGVKNFEAIKVLKLKA